MSLISVTEQAGNSLVSQFPQSFSARMTARLLSRVSDYTEMCRPRIAMMTMVAVAAGFVLASPISIAWSTLLIAVLAIVQLVAASSIFNQMLEQHTDGLMNRTADRPISAGRISAIEASFSGSLLATTGTLLLWTYTNPATTLATFATFLIYAFLYTPLKSRTSLCTTVGAIPGAMPPVLGWLAAGGHVGIEAISLFGLFFVWQFPHFLAIGWLHRNDYARAGLRMLPAFNDNGRLTGILAVVYAVAFVPVSMLPAYTGLASDVYCTTAFCISVTYLIFSVRFLISRSEAKARRLMMVSLICLPTLLLVLVSEFVFLTGIR
jgi:protoheme IX farnesyltransferase